MSEKRIIEKGVTEFPINDSTQEPQTPEPKKKMVKIELTEKITISLAQAQIKIKGLVIEINEDYIRFSCKYNDFKVTMDEIDRIMDISPANIDAPWVRRDYFRCLKTC